MLIQENAIRSFLKEEARLQKGRYKLRQTVFVFACLGGCGAEIEVRRSDLKKVSGRCRKCADKYVALKSSLRNRKRPYEALYNRFLYDRSRNGVETDLTFDDFLEFTKKHTCHYCDEPVSWSECALGTNGYRYNLDRKNPKAGYTKDNCAVCCWDCNQTKSNRFSYEEFLQLAPVLRTIKQDRKRTNGNQN